MLSIFRRLFRVAEAETHAVIDKIEDPVKLTEQGIRDLKRDLTTNLQSIAEAKAVLIKLRRDAEEKKELAASYEKKAILLLKKAEGGLLDQTEADRLASEALNKKEAALAQVLSSTRDLEAQEKQTDQLQTVINRLKSNISKWENELITLKARAKVAQASKKLNKQLAQVDSEGTMALLEKMKAKVTEDEALAASYGEIAAIETNLDAEIDQALGSGSQSSSDSLAALKAKLRGG